MPKPIKINFGGYQGPNSVHTYGAEVFCAALRRIAGDAVEVSFHADITDTGRNASDLLGLTEDGTFDGCYFSSSYLAPRVPALTLFDLHFAVPDKAKAFALLDGEAGDILAGDVTAHTGFTTLGYWDNGLRHMTAPDRALLAPADCDGLSLRILPNDNHNQIFQSMGFRPQVIDVKEVTAAVNSGAVDAQENPLTNTYNMGLSKSQRVVTLSGHLMGISLVLFNRAIFASWPDDIQAAIMQAVAEATTAQRARAQSDEAASKAAMQKDGVTFVALTPAQRLAFKAAVKPTVSRIASDISPALLNLFNVELEATP